MLSLAAPLKPLEVKERERGEEGEDEEEEEEEEENKRYEPLYPSTRAIQGFVDVLEQELNLPHPQFNYQVCDQLGIGTRERKVEEVALFCLFRRIGFFVAVACSRICLLHEGGEWNEWIGFVQLVSNERWCSLLTRLVILMYHQSKIWMKVRPEGGKINWEMRRRQMEEVCQSISSTPYPPSLPPSLSSPSSSPLIPLPSSVPEKVWRHLMMIWTCQACLYDTSPWDGYAALCVLVPSLSRGAHRSQQKIPAIVTLHVQQTVDDYPWILAHEYETMDPIAFAAWATSFSVIDSLQSRSELTNVSKEARRTMDTIQQSLKLYLSAQHYE